MYNAEIDALKKVSTKKIKGQAAEKSREKAENDVEESTKCDELLPRFKQELELLDLDGILGLATRNICVSLHSFLFFIKRL